LAREFERLKIYSRAATRFADGYPWDNEKGIISIDNKVLEDVEVPETKG